MSHWGTITSIIGDKHIVPCDREGEVMNNHVATIGCWCSPVKEADEPIWVHQDPELSHD